MKVGISCVVTLVDVVSDQLVELLFAFRLVRGFARIPDCPFSFSKLSSHRLLVHRVNTRLGQRSCYHRLSVLWNRLIRNDSFHHATLSQFKTYLNSLNLDPLLEGCASKAL